MLRKLRALLSAPPGPPEWTDADLRAAVERIFPPDEREPALAALQRYGVLDYEREAPRVRRVIVQTCRGSLERLRKLVDVAKRDYRNVLIGDRGPNAPLG